MPFSYRRINNHTLDIFNKTGKVVQLIMRVGSDTPTPYTPGQNLFVENEDPSSATFTYRYIKGNFEESDDQAPSEVGRQRIVKGRLTVPLLYKDLLNQAEYINPYNDGVSRFTKTSAVIDRGRLFCSVDMESVSVKPISGVQQ